MSYKTILVHVDDSGQAEVRMIIAAQLAKLNNAHLNGTAVTGISRYLYQDINMGGMDPNISLHLDFLNQRAEKALQRFTQIAINTGIESYEGMVASDEAAGGIGLQARYSDLVVIGQTNLKEPSPSVLTDFPEYIVVHAGRPILIIPHTGKATAQPKRAVVAWDGSREASRAVTDAIPFLKKAELVHVAVFNPESFPYIHGDEPGADIALYLSRHGIKVEVMAKKTAGDVGEALLSLARTVEAELIVMGGYGHSRFREMLLGGVTKTVLEKMDIPVLMSH